jgi:hypothetical protein
LRTAWRDFGAAHAKLDRRAAVRADEPRIQEGRCDMDVVTQIRLLWLGGLGALAGVALGTVWLLSRWQYRREQRRSQLLESVELRIANAPRGDQEGHEWEEDAKHSRSNSRRKHRRPWPA